MTAQEKITRPRPIFPSNMLSTTERLINAQRISVITAIAAFIASGFISYLVSQNPRWQLYTLVLASTFLTIASIATAILARYEKHWSIWLLILTGQVVFLIAAIVITGSGLVSLISIISLSVLVAILCLPDNQSRIAISIALLTGTFSGLMDWIRPEFSMVAPAMLKFTLPILLAVVMLLVGMLLLSNIRRFSLRTQMSLSFILASSLSIGAVTLINNMVTSRTITADVNRQLSNAAKLTAFTIENLLATNLNSIGVNARLPFWHDYLDMPSDQRIDSQSESLAIQTLYTLKQKDPDNIVIYSLVDPHGVVLLEIPQGKRGENLSSRDYFKELIKSGSPVISPVEFTPDSDEPLINFAAPIKNETGEIKGILRMGINASLLQSVLEHNLDLSGPHSYAQVFDEYHVRLAHGLDSTMRFKSATILEEKLWIQLIQEYRLPALPRQQLSTNLPGLEKVLQNAETQQSFTAQVEISQQGRDLDGDMLDLGAVVNLGIVPWKVIYTQSRTVLLAPIEAQIRSNALLAILIAGLVLLGGQLLANNLTLPISQLTHVAKRITAGNYYVDISGSMQGEFETLATAFNQMIEHIRDNFESLENRVSIRTQELEKRALQLRITAEVGQAITSIRSLEELLPHVTQLVSERFGYYHVGIFLIDPSDEFAELKASNSVGGQRMLARGHQLRIGEVGLVGHVAAQREARIAQNVGLDTVHYNNPDLPDTKSEMALPLVAKDRLLGILDVQSTNENAFSQEDIATLQILADQIAVAIDNSRLFAENQWTMEALRRTYREQSVVAWDQLLTKRTEFSLLVNQQDIIFPSDRWTDEMRLASANNQVIVCQDRSIIIPISVGELVLGIIRLQKPGMLDWSNEELTTITTLAQQLYLALDSARLYQETQIRAERERTAGEIVARMRTSNNPQEIMQTAVHELSSALQASRVQILISSYAPQSFDEADIEISASDKSNGSMREL